ncbi:MAG: dTMP kinase, partial [Pyrinomonadaceae bacterium]
MERGAWVICDRFADSTVAYQGYGHRLGRPAIDLLHELV